jgi:cobalt-zinc-cadmium efflux system membrane fusion protein
MRIRWNHFVVLVVALMGISACREKPADGVQSAGEPAGGAITLWTDSTELFMEHPALIVGAPDKFAVHLTDITDFTPLRSGRITLRFQPRDGGAPLIVVQDTPRAPGIYGPSPTFAKAGIYDLMLLVNSPQAKDSIFVPSLRVYATAAQAPKDTGGTETGIRFLKEQQWKTPGFRTVFAVQGAISGSIDVPGQIVAAGARQAEVSAPITGLIDAGSIARAPVPGRNVSRGQVLAVIAPSLGEGGSSYAEARARLREAADEHERAKRLVAAEAAPARRVHEAEIRLQAAREALVGLGGQAGRVPVHAPISGVVVRRSVPLGSRVEAGAPLFTIVDPSVVWLTVNIPASAAGLVSFNSTATFTVEGSSRNYPATRIVSIGSVIDPVSRTVPIIYELNNPDGTLKVGANARASVRTGGIAEGVVVPTSAILDDNGRPIVFVQPEGEKFERREVILGGRQGELTLIQSGVAAGERVVSGAAYQVKLASLSTAVPAHGHEH